MLTAQWQWNTIGRDLVDRYAAANDGRFPPLDSARRDNFQLWRANRTQAGYDESIPIINDYRDWFNNEFFKYDQETCSDAMWVSIPFLELKLRALEESSSECMLTSRYVYDVGTGGWPVRSLGSVLKLNCHLALPCPVDARYTADFQAYREAILNNGRDAFTPFVDPLNK